MVISYLQTPYGNKNLLRYPEVRSQADKINQLAPLSGTRAHHTTLVVCGQAEQK